MTREDLELKLFNYKIESESDYNDGWTKQHYKELSEKLETKLKSIGKQLKIEF